MNFQLRILRTLFNEVVSDLRRPHKFASERVGFITCRTGTIEGGFLLLPSSYEAVFDADYLPDLSVGARIGSNAIRRAMQNALDNDVTILHVHLHDHSGKPGMSDVDEVTNRELIPAFFNVRSNRPHGALILSRDAASLWMSPGRGERPIAVDDISIVGNPMRLMRAGTRASLTPALVRQSFLGGVSEAAFQAVRVAIVGLGGGGAHVVQQLVHLGVTHFLLFDPDVVEISNLNRLVGATLSDVENKTKKAVVAERYIKSVNPKAVVERFDVQWQDGGAAIRRADIVFGCVDTFLARQQLESTTQRYFIPFIDIGMDVTECEGQYFMSGQTIVSMPGSHCMKCLRFLTDEKLAKEAAKYGEAGEHPQVVWANGALASTAVGKFVHLITGWTGPNDLCEYDSYDGNSGRIVAHSRLGFRDKFCSHYPVALAGDPVFA